MDCGIVMNPCSDVALFGEPGVVNCRVAGPPKMNWPLMQPTLTAITQIYVQAL